jgi:hypothetical protein
MEKGKNISLVNKHSVHMYARMYECTVRMYARMHVSADG